MKRERKFEFLLLLTFIAAFGLCFQAQKPVRPPVKSVTRRTASVSTPTILRWSSRGGCFAESDFYFELRTDRTGASRIALLCAYGSWQENLLDREGGQAHQRGNYVASGRLSVKQTNQLIEALNVTEPLMVRSHQFHTGPVTSLYVRLGDEENKVANFQANWEADESPEYRFISFAFSGIFEQAHNSLTARYEAGERPDCQPKAPGLQWLTDETESLFCQYSERLPKATTASSN